jgi:hypothetical protein
MSKDPVLVPPQSDSPPAPAPPPKQAGPEAPPPNAPEKKAADEEKTLEEQEVLDSVPLTGRGLTPSPPKGKEMAADLLRIAHRHRSAGNYQKAAKTYALVTARAPGSVSSYAAQVSHAGVLLRLGKVAAAKRLYLSAQKQSPGGSLQPEITSGLESIRNINAN